MKLLKYIGPEAEEALCPTAIRYWAVPYESRMSTPTYTSLSLMPSSAGEPALQLLHDPLSADPVHQQLFVQAGGVTEADAYTGAALRARIESHVRRFAAGGVDLWPPTAEPQLSRL